MAYIADANSLTLDEPHAWIGKEQRPILFRLDMNLRVHLLTYFRAQSVAALGATSAYARRYVTDDNRRLVLAHAYLKGPIVGVALLRISPLCLRDLFLLIEDENDLHLPTGETLWLHDAPGAHAVRFHETIKRLRISFAGDDPKCAARFTATVAQAIGTALPSSLRELALDFESACGITDESVHALAASTRHLHTLVAFEISFMCFLDDIDERGQVRTIGDVSAKAVGGMLPHQLHCLVLIFENTLLTHRGIQSIMSSLALLAQLRHLSLSFASSFVSVRGLQSIAEGMPTQLSELFIDLSDTQLDHHGLQLLARSFPSGLRSLTLNMSENAVQDRDIDNIAGHLPSELLFLKLDVSFTEVHGYLEVFFDYLPKTLKALELDFSENELREMGTGAASRPALFAYCVLFGRWHLPFGLEHLSIQIRDLLQHFSADQIFKGVSCLAAHIPSSLTCLDLGLSGSAPSSPVEDFTQELVKLFPQGSYCNVEYSILESET